MSPELAQIATGVPVAGFLVAAGSARLLWTGRRRSALNEALHELRRPLQALALALPSGGAVEPALDSSLWMATAALERLDREINGRPAAPAVALVPLRPLVEAAVARWQPRAALTGGPLVLRWEAADPVLAANRCELAQALDNLITNAIEHGGPAVTVEAVESIGRLRLAVRDSGRGDGPLASAAAGARLVARVSGRGRRGHGLRVVRRIASAHGGRFQLLASATGTEAVLELPSAGAEGR